MRLSPIIKDDPDKVEILCKVSLDKMSNPEYTIVINKKDKSATCYGTSEPPVILTIRK